VGITCSWCEVALEFKTSTLVCCVCMLLQVFYLATTSSSTSGSDDRLIVVGGVMSKMSGPLRSKLTSKLSELAEQKQNRIAKRAGMKGLDSGLAASQKSAGLCWRAVCLVRHPERSTVCVLRVAA
jgi:hypothetical protein